MNIRRLDPDRRHLLALTCIATLAITFALPAQSQSLDHSHAAWTALLKKHVVLLDGGKASQLRYAGMQADHPALKAYLAQLSAVSEPTFDGYTKPQQMAFLINAYNAYTVEAILTKYPKLDSIRELGNMITKAWDIKNIPLLGTTLTLDNIEHNKLRAKGRYDDPRIHFAVNCASIGCPMLREEAFVPERLEAQLEEQALRFMSDRSRNRFNASSGKLEVSKIFDWYGGDFKLGHKGIASLPSFAAKYANQLADAPADRERIKAMDFSVSFLSYDWKLNDAR
jgi:hypothetical protein